MSRQTQAAKKDRGKTRSTPERESGRAPSRASRTPDAKGATRRTATGVTAPVTATPSAGRRSGKPRPAERTRPTRGAEDGEHRSGKGTEREPPVGETPGRKKAAESPPRHAPKRGPREKQGEEVGALDPEPAASGRNV